MNRSGAVSAELPRWTDAHELTTKSAKRKVRSCDFLSLGKICPLERVAEWGSREKTFPLSAALGRSSAREGTPADRRPFRMSRLTVRHK